VDERRIAVVTGGSGGIGGAIVAALAAAGHAVVSLDQVGDPAVDLGREEEVRAAAGSVLGRPGRCDLLVHAAADTVRAPPAGDMLPYVTSKGALVPEDVAATVAFLASDAAAALTGQTLCTDGGLILR
jgi:NAD(P)-dependent dehydrogenase (short-subunit alcohol dehydrogenase family)